MSLLDDFNKFDTSVKEVITGYLIVAPYWYIDIYLFNKEFFNQAPYYIPILISLCLTTSQFFLFIVYMVFSAVNEEEEKFNAKVLFKTPIVLSVLLLSITSVDAFINHQEFIKVVKSTFMFPTFVNIGLFIGIGISNAVKFFKNRKKKKTKERESELDF